MPRRALIAAGLGAGTLALALAIGDPLEFETALSLLVGWSFLASGCVAWTRRPENHVGVLMVVIGLMWFVSRMLRDWMAPLPLTAGIWLGDAWLLPLAYLLAGFPLGRLEHRTERLLIGALVVAAIPLEFVWLAFLNFDSFGEPGAPRNVLMLADEPGLAEAVDTVQRVIVIAALAALSFLLAQRWRRASRCGGSSPRCSRAPPD
jgi:hypothetical protein